MSSSDTPYDIEPTIDGRFRVSGPSAGPGEYATRGEAALVVIALNLAYMKGMQAGFAQGQAIALQSIDRAFAST